MFMLLYMGLIATVYVQTFKDDFNPEQIDKAGPFIFIACGGLIVLGILGSLLGSH